MSHHAPGQPVPDEEPSTTDGPGLPADLGTKLLLRSITNVYADMAASLAAAVTELVNLHTEHAYQRGRADGLAAAARPAKNCRCRGETTADPGTTAIPGVTVWAGQQPPLRATLAR